ncbi:MAG: YndJ family protein [Deltaproteobacteria bacterium]|nr:YndJ family protein [Deltaproteobacteria bacterium]
MFTNLITFISLVYGKKRHDISSQNWKLFLLTINFLLGSILWVLLSTSDLLGLIHLDYIKQIFLIAPLMVVPLALVSFEFRNVGSRVKMIWNMLLLSQAPAALLTSISFLFHSGSWLAFCLVLPWLLFSAVLALLALNRLRHRGFMMLEEWAMDIACIYIFVGSLWLVASRLGLQLMGFGDVIVLLTAVHFHFAGFATAIILGLIGRMLKNFKDKKRLQQFYPFLAFFVLMGMPLVATGITFRGHVEWFAVCIFALSMMVMAIFILKVCVVQAYDKSIAMMWKISAYSIFAGMGLALVYAWGLWRAKPILLIPDMVVTHGFINSIGFAASALMAEYFQKMKRLVQSLKKEMAS